MATGIKIEGANQTKPWRRCRRALYRLNTVWSRFLVMLSFSLPFPDEWSIYLYIFFLSVKYLSALDFVSLVSKNLKARHLCSVFISHGFLVRRRPVRFKCLLWTNALLQTASTEKGMVVVGWMEGKLSYTGQLWAPCFYPCLNRLHECFWLKTHYPPWRHWLSNDVLNTDLEKLLFHLAPLWRKETDLEFFFF